MQYKYPAIFYFLLVLIIPVIVHLFQLQRFKKIAFTNVQFLKKIRLETRKSSRLKKLLILATRILCFLALLFTFSQPYYSDKKIVNKKHNFIYLDNSMSLNTSNENGNELLLATQKIIDYASENATYTFFTNDDQISNISKKELTSYLKKIKFSTINGTITDKIASIEYEIKNKSNYSNESILISDFQYFGNKINNEFTNVTIPLSLVKLNRNRKNNISIDSVFINTASIDKNVISVVIKNQGETKENIPIALYNNSKLINKRSFSMEENEVKIIEFPILNLQKFKGKIQLTFNDTFLFDNSFYFTINTPKKTTVLNIGRTSNSFSKVFTKEDFLFTNSTLDKLDYNLIQSQQLIILNQLKSISNVLETSILQFVKNGGHLLIVPDQNINITTYNSFFNKITSGSIFNYKKDSLKITEINFQHPLFIGVFSKQVTNFQYPSSSYSYNHNLEGDKILSFQNKTTFLQEITNPFSKIYWFSSPLDYKSSNFINSPLIVPTLFNIGQQSLKLAKPYYILQEENTIEINKKIKKDEILKISNASNSFIPLQQMYSSKVALTTNEDPKDVGFYDISLKKDTLATVAYNISPTESLLSYYDLDSIKKENKNIHVYSSVEELFKEINEKNEVQWLWRLFLAIAIVSLLLEVLILKFFKT
jgi:hypothetical protein